MFKTAYKLKPEGGAIIGSFKEVPSDFIEYTEDSKPQELIDAEAFKTPEDIKQTLKRLYLGVVDAKLKELDYTSMATVNIWLDDSIYGTEATRIKNWYKSVTSLSIKIENDVLDGARPLPTDEQFLSEINATVF